MQAVFGNTATVESVLQRPEWGGDGEVHINLKVGADELNVMVLLAGKILDDKGFGEPTVGFELHSVETWLNNTELSEPFKGTDSIIGYIKEFVGGVREYNDLYDDLKEHQYLLYNLEDAINGKSSITDLDKSLSAQFRSKNNAYGQHEKEHESMSKYDISARVNPLKDPKSHVKAMASVTIDNVIAINDLTVVEGKNGLFVGYPQSKDKDGSFREIVQFLKDGDGKMTKESMELKDAIQKTLVDMFKKGEPSTPDKTEQDKKPVDHDVKAFVTPLRDSQNATRGLATVQVGELFKVGSVRINENTKEGSDNFGKNFVAMPSRPDKSADGGYKDIVHPVNKEFGDKFRDTVLKQYENQLAYKNRANNKEQSAPQHDKPAANKSNPDIN